MTLDEFKDEYSDIASLLDFVSDNNLDYPDGIYYWDSYDECVCEEVKDMVRGGNSFTEIRDYLDQLPYDGDYYYYSYGDWCSADDYFDDIAEEIYNDANDRGVFDEEDDEEEEESIEMGDYSATEKTDGPLIYLKIVDESVEDEPITIDALFSL